MSRERVASAAVPRRMPDTLRMSATGSDVAFVDTANNGTFRDVSKEFAE